MKNIKQYQNVQVLTADGVRLIIMLYDGVVRFNKGAQMAIEAGDIQGRNLFINKSMAIISELMNSLNMERGGEVARKLESLYDFCINELNTANMKNDAKPLDSVNRVMGELRQGWEAIATDRVRTQAEPQKSVSYAR